MTSAETGPLHAIRRITWIGAIANLLLSAIKFCAGVFGHSQVLIADAVHSLSDLATDVVLLVGSRYWERPADEDHPHGHGKIESLVALVIGLVLLLVALGLIRGACITLHDFVGGKRIPLPTKLPFFAALVSIVIKEWLYRITLRVATQTRSSAVAANAIDHRSDALSSIPAAISVAVCLLFGERWSFVDPVGTILVACLILYSVWQIIRTPIQTLLDQGETTEKLDQIRAIADELSDIRSIHKIRTRPMGNGHFAVDLHIQVDPDMQVRDAHELSHRFGNRIKNRVDNIVDVVVHIEPEEENQTPGETNS